MAPMGWAIPPGPMPVIGGRMRGGWLAATWLTSSDSAGIVVPSGPTSSAARSGWRSLTATSITVTSSPGRKRATAVKGRSPLWPLGASPQPLRATSRNAQAASFRAGCIRLLDVEGEVLAHALLELLVERGHQLLGHRVPRLVAFIRRDSLGDRAAQRRRRLDIALRETVIDQDVEAPPGAGILTLRLLRR